MNYKIYYATFRWLGSKPPETKVEIKLAAASKIEALQTAEEIETISENWILESVHLAKKK